MSKELKQINLFDKSDMPYKWEDEWQDMPEFVQEDKTPYQQIIVSFTSEKDVKEFSQLINQKLTYKTKSIWYPKQDIIEPKNFRYENES